MPLLPKVYKTGTVSIESGATVAVGGGTYWSPLAGSVNVLFITGFPPTFVDEVVDDTHLNIPEWTGADVVDAEYRLAAFAAPSLQASNDLIEHLARLARGGVCHIVPDDEDAPDPSYGADDDVAIKLGSNTLTIWKKIAGAWVLGATFGGDTYNGVQAASIAAAATTDIWGINGTSAHVTGSGGPITSFGVASRAGLLRTVIFDGSPRINAGANIVLPNELTYLQAEPGGRATVYADTTTKALLLNYTALSAGGLTLFLLAVMQSNGSVLPAKNWTPPPNFKIWNNTLNVHSSVGTAFVTPSATVINTPIRDAAVIAAAMPHRQVRLLICAVGAMPIENFIPALHTPPYDLWNTLILPNLVPAMADAGVTKVDALKLWVIESNFGAMTMYPENIERFIAQCRAESWFPHNTPIYMIGGNEIGDVPGILGHKIGNDVLMRCAEAEPGVRTYVHSADYKGAWTDGGLHTSADGAWAIGETLANAFLGRNRREKVPANVLSLGRDMGMQWQGLMEVDQVNEGAAVAWADNGLIIDGFRLKKTGTMAGTTQRVAITDMPGFVRAIEFKVTTAQASLGATDRLQIRIPITARDMAQLSWGVGAAHQPLSVGILMQSDTALNLGISVQNALINLHNFKMAAVPGTNKWTLLSAMIDGQAVGGGGTWGETESTDNVRAWIGITLAAGSGLQGTNGLWDSQVNHRICDATQGNYVGAVGRTLRMTGLLIWPGPRLPPLHLWAQAMRRQPDEFRRCQRLIWKTYADGTAPGSGSVGAPLIADAVWTHSISSSYVLPFSPEWPVPMVGAPTCSFWSTIGTANKLSYAGNIDTPTLVNQIGVSKKRHTGFVDGAFGLTPNVLVCGHVLANAHPA